ncbi:flagellar export chaperone FliS [Gammaproteobacteria bacterium AB-CW1]|uniref:Flagellar secretion chaperone FliS n=1 Tax=Natronospira elongata TaxID=3110268 RepID=A0AAP6JGA9_9GAMM|nr:flagellar export chaperone FliS [Gammaproteobacteria bacterium AB-CW1]
MYNVSRNAALTAYREMSVQGGVDEANPYRLIQMLMEGALDRIYQAQGCLERGEVGPKGEQIGRAVNIIDSLRAMLDHSHNPELSERLEQLYDYMCRRLTEANLYNDMEKLDEVAGLMREVKAGWDAIPDEAVQEAASHKQAPAAVE